MTKKRKGKKKPHSRKQKKILTLVGSIVIITTILLVSYFSVDYVYGWDFTDESFGNSSVIKGTYHEKANTLKFDDPDRGSYCFAKVDFHLSYGIGTFSFYMRIADKSQLNFEIEFVGSNGIFSRVQELEDELPEENVWYKIDYKYNCPNNTFSLYLDNVLFEGNLTNIIPSNDFTGIFVTTNNDGIAEVYFNIIKLN